MNKNLSTEKYYQKLNEDWKTVAKALGLIGLGGAAGFGLESIIDYFKTGTSDGSGGSKAPPSDLSATQRGTKAGTGRIESMVSKPGENPADE